MTTDILKTFLFALTIVLCGIARVTAKDLSEIINDGRDVGAYDDMQGYEDVLSPQTMDELEDLKTSLGVLSRLSNSDPMFSRMEPPENGDRQVGSITSDMDIWPRYPLNDAKKALSRDYQTKAKFVDFDTNGDQDQQPSPVLEELLQSKGTMNMGYPSLSPNTDIHRPVYAGSNMIQAMEEANSPRFQFENGELSSDFHKNGNVCVGQGCPVFLTDQGHGHPVENQLLPSSRLSMETFPANILKKRNLFETNNDGSLVPIVSDKSTQDSPELPRMCKYFSCVSQDGPFSRFPQNHRQKSKQVEDKRLFCNRRGCRSAVNKRDAADVSEDGTDTVETNKENFPTECKGKECLLKLIRLWRGKTRENTDIGPTSSPSTSLYQEKNYADKRNRFCNWRNGCGSRQRKLKKVFRTGREI